MPSAPGLDGRGLTVGEILEWVVTLEDEAPLHLITNR